MIADLLIAPLFLLPIGIEQLVNVAKFGGGEWTK